MKKAKQVISWILGIGASAWIVWMAYTIVGSAYYSVYKTDDFRHAMGIGIYGGSVWAHLTKSWTYMVLMYKNWQGTYLSMFLQALLSPLNGYGLAQMHLVMSGMAFAFIASVVFLVIVLAKFYDHKVSLGVALLLAACALWQLLGSDSYEEVFEWFSGAVSYSLPATLMCLTLAFFILMQKYKKRVYLVLACILGFFMSGGTLTLVGFGCSTVLLLLMEEWVQRKKFDWRNFLVFICCLFGALINTLAPGNYVRESVVEGEKLTLMGTVGASFSNSWKGVTWLFTETNLKLLLIVVLAIGFCLGNVEKRKQGIRLIFAILGLLVPIVVAFPVVLAYRGVYYPNRCMFVLYFSVTLMYLNFAFILGGFLKSICENMVVQKSMVAAVAVCVMVFAVLGIPFKDTIGYKQWVQLSNGLVKSYYFAQVQVLLDIENSEEADVGIVDYPYPIPYFSCPVMSFYLDDGYNDAYIAFYGKNSIYVENYAYIEKQLWTEKEYTHKTILEY